MTAKTLRHSVNRFLILPFTVFLFTSTNATSAQAPQPFKITNMKAMLFYEDKGTFSEDVSEIDTGPPYVPPKLWNTPMQYENRSNSMLVTVEVTGEPVVERKLEFIASYVPSMRESGAIVVRRVVTVHLPLKAGERDSFHAGFWLNQTGCNPVRLSARIIGRKEAPAVKKVVRFGCGE